MFKVVSFLVLMSVAVQAKAGRSEDQCSPLQSEVVAWYAPADLKNWQVRHSQELIAPQAIESIAAKDSPPSLPPIRNQFTTYWCFAFAAADQIEISTGHRLSATQLATNYYQTFGIQSLDFIHRGGFGIHAVQAAFGKQLCDEQDFPYLKNSSLPPTADNIADYAFLKEQRCNNPHVVLRAKTCARQAPLGLGCARRSPPGG